MSDKDPQHILAHLVELTNQFAMGDYSRAQELFDLTGASSPDPMIEELAEAFGMMMVQIEAREFRLENLIAELKDTNQQLQATLNKIKLLENIQSHMSKFVPQSVKTLIDKNPEAPDLAKHNRDVSVLFLDIAGYTRMSERVATSEMNYLIERYFSAFLDDIHQNHGDINETAGDGLMIIFQDEDPGRNAGHAVGCALNIQQKVRAINQEEKERNQPVTVNIGINSGMCSVGSTCFEGVSGTRWTFTATGSVTNLAARIGALATDGKVLVGPETKRRVEGRFPIQEAGEHRLKNVSQPVTVFEVLTG